MLTPEVVAALPKDQMGAVCAELGGEDVAQLVEWLAFSDDAVRYNAFLLLKCRSAVADDVYTFWDVFQAKLKSGNSYQRSIGLTLMACNAKWDSAGKMEASLDDCLTLLRDEKPITVRQCIQGLGVIAGYRPNLGLKITDSLLAFDLAGQRQTMRKLILLDIIETLTAIAATSDSDAIETFILDALCGDILDKKAKKQVEMKMCGR